MKRVNLTDQKFGRLTAIRDSGRKANDGHVLWECLCDCGEFTLVSNNNLKQGGVQSCGCYAKDGLIQRNRVMTGKKHPRYGCVGAMHGLTGKNHPMYGYKPSGELRLKLSKIFSGSNNPNWRGGTSGKRQIEMSKFKYKDWRKDIFEKDNYTCQCCGDQSGGNLNAHHIKSYCDNPELRTEINNGITFCQDCHNDFHHQYGRGNNTQEQIDKFLMDRNN